MAQTLTFRKEAAATGLAKVANPYQATEIKYQGKIVGHIDTPDANGKWRIRFAIKKEPTQQDPCPWRWARMKAAFDSEADARQWVKDNEAAIFNLDLYKINA